MGILIKAALPFFSSADSKRKSRYCHVSGGAVCSTETLVLTITRERRGLQSDVQTQTANVSSVGEEGAGGTQTTVLHQY